MSRILGLIAAIAGLAILAWLIAGANGFLAEAERFEIAAGIPLTLLSALGATSMVIVGGACFFDRFERRGG